MTQIDHGPSVIAATSLEDEGAEVMAELGLSIAGVLQCLPGAVNRAVDLERLIEVNRKLAWQIFRLSRSASLADAADVPATASVQRVLAAARRKRVPPAALERVEAAMARFEEFARVHGGGRDGLVSAITNITQETNTGFELKTRRSLFLGNAHVWGVQAQVQLRTAIVHLRAGEPGSEDGLALQGLVGLQRLRHGQPFSFTSGFKPPPAPDGEPPPGGDHAQSRPHAMELLPDFCSKPLPELIPRPTRNGGVETELSFPASGRAGAITLYTSRLVENCQGPGTRDYGLNVMVAIPTGTLIAELLVPAGTTLSASARALVYGRRGNPVEAMGLQNGDVLPQRETFTYLGRAEEPPPVPEAPRHHEAVRESLRRRGWLGTQFDLYRCRVEYPVLHTLLYAHVDAAAM